MPKPTPVDPLHLFRHLPQHYLVVATNDPVFTLIEENESHAAIAMRTPESTIGKPFFEVFPDTTEKFKATGVSDLMESLRTVIRTKQKDDMDALRYDIPKPDGSLEERWWRATHYPVLNDEGNVAYIVQATNDITEEIVSNQQAKAAQQSLDDILAVGSIGTWYWDIPNETVTADRNLAAMFGVTPEEAIAGLPLSVFTDSIYAEDRPRVAEAISQAVAEHGRFEQEYRTIAQDGSLHWVIARGAVEADEDGNARTFPGVIVDITERKLAEINLNFLADASRVLTQSLDRDVTLHGIAELATKQLADICTIDLFDPGGNGRMVTAVHRDPRLNADTQKLAEGRMEPSTNPAIGRGLVLSKGEAVYYPEIDATLLKALSHTAKEHRYAKQLDLTSLIIVPIIVESSVIGTITLIGTGQRHHFTEADFQTAKELGVRISLAMTNVAIYQTLEKRVEERTEQLAATNLSLERSNQELQDFAYVASHDLQEPLRKIQAFGDLLEDEYGKDLGEGTDYLKRMRNAASRMSTLIEDLLSFSRVTTHGKAPVKIDLNKIAGEVVEDLENRISSTGGRVDIGKLPHIEADPTQMRQLLQNLIGNALKFHKPDEPSIVTVSSEDLGNGEIRLSVNDNGVGFDEKYLDRIFAVFQRLHGRGAYEGTGIGLAVCRKIVERHNGTITAASQPNIGSTFIITLPKKAYKGDSNGQ